MFDKFTLQNLADKSGGVKQPSCTFYTSHLKYTVLRGDVFSYRRRTEFAVFLSYLNL